MWNYNIFVIISSLVIPCSLAFIANTTCRIWWKFVSNF